MINVNSGVESRINDIHNASHCYVCELVNGVLQAKQLSDSDKTLWVDGTTATVEANQDVMMKLPRFWWKAIPDENDDDICEINFTMDNPEDNTWFEWEGNTFIGVYKGYVSDSKLYSHSGNVGAYTRTTLNNYRNYARNRGTGYTLLTYEVIQILALLGFGRLKRLNPYNVYGTTGVNSDPQTRGQCDNLGMTDGRNGSYTSFWGLESYITGSGLSEIVDNISRGTDLFNILDTSNLSSVKRVVSCPSYYSGNSWCKKIKLGAYGDVFPKEVTTSKPSNTAAGYGGYVNITNNGFVHNNYANTNNTSFVSLSATSGTGTALIYASSRLCYKGNYQIIT